MSSVAGAAAQAQVGKFAGANQGARAQARGADARGIAPMLEAGMPPIAHRNARACGREVVT
jgi:hypothetical protein